MRSVIPHHRKSSPMNAVMPAVKRALPDAPPWKHSHAHTRSVTFAGAIAGLVIATVACALLLTHRGERAGDGGEEQAPAGAKE